MPISSHATDREVLTKGAYADVGNLEARRAIYAYRQPHLDLVGEVVARLSDVRGLVADVGCGSGAYTRRLRAERPDLTVAAFDLSRGMLAATGMPGAVADAAQLPLPDHGCGGVLALHMLYHVPDLEATLAELARVRADHGVVVISTNATDDKAELADVFGAAARDVTGTSAPELFATGSRFTLEDGERAVRRHFRSVHRIDHHGETVVSDLEPVLAFLASTRHIAGAGLPFDEVLAAAQVRIRATIATHGAFRFTNHTGLLVCR